MHRSQGISLGQNNPKFAEYSTEQLAQTFGWIQGRLHAHQVSYYDANEFLREYGAIYNALGDELIARNPGAANEPEGWMEDILNS